MWLFPASVAMPKPGRSDQLFSMKAVAIQIAPIQVPIAVSLNWIVLVRTIQVLSQKIIKVVAFSLVELKSAIQMVDINGSEQHFPGSVVV